MMCSIESDFGRLTAAIDKSLYVFWTVPTGSSVELHGGTLITDPASPEAFTLPAKNLLPPMDLGPAAAGVSPEAG